MATTNESQIVGSWFPSGYYGHYRSKPRNDFICEFRQLAKPQPPGKFINRSLQPSSVHAFSEHDNTHYLETDAHYFGHGKGKRRHPTMSYSHNPDFCAWMPIKQELERNRPEVTTYQLNFTGQGRTLQELLPSQIPHQALVHQPRTSFEGVPTSSYRYAHGEVAPHKAEVTKMAGKALQLTAHFRAHEGLKKNPPCRDSVAMCLSWYRPGAKSTAVAEAACV